MDGRPQTIAREWPNDEACTWVTALAERFRAHTATIGIIGLGYVGLPLACTMAKKGFLVLGFDIDSKKVDQINDGRSYITHINSDDVEKLRGSGRLGATNDYERLIEVDAIIVCVPTPLTRQREPD